MVLSVKITLLSILARIFNLHKHQRIGVYSVLAVVIIYYTIIFFIKVFVCSPVSAFWTIPEPGGQCLRKSAVILSDAVMSVLTDLVILVLPFALTLPLKLPNTKKLRVALMLGSAGLAIGFSIYRLVLVIKEKNNLNSTVIFMKILLSG
jgi:hypothetical protein